MLRCGVGKLMAYGLTAAATIMYNVVLMVLWRLLRDKIML